MASTPPISFIVYKQQLPADIFSYTVYGNGGTPTTKKKVKQFTALSQFTAMDVRCPFTQPKRNITIIRFCFQPKKKQTVTDHQFLVCVDAMTNKREAREPYGDDALLKICAPIRRVVKRRRYSPHMFYNKERKPHYAIIAFSVVGDFFCVILYVVLLVSFYGYAVCVFSFTTSCLLSYKRFGLSIVGRILG